MRAIRRLGRFLGVLDDDEPPYRCIHCGTGFERDYHDCPACGQPHVVSVGEDPERD